MFTFFLEIGTANIFFRRAEMVQWVAKSLQPFSIVEDHGFRLLMKMGCPEYYIPSATMVSCDAQLVFARTHNWIAKILQVSETID